MLLAALRLAARRHMNYGSLIRSLGALGLCLLVVGCGGSDLPSTAESDKEVAAVFSVLRGNPEHLPPSLSRHVARLLKPSERDTPVNTQRVGTSEGAVWIFLNGPKMCLAQANFGSIACVTKRLARSQGVVLGTFKPPTKQVPRMHKFSVLGVVPDEVRYVAATIGRGSHRRRVRIPVRSNAFAVAAEQSILVDALKDDASRPYKDRR